MNSSLWKVKSTQFDNSLFLDWNSSTKTFMLKLYSVLIFIRIKTKSMAAQFGRALGEEMSGMIEGRLLELGIR